MTTASPYPRFSLGLSSAQILSACLMVLFTCADCAAQSPDALAFFKNYFVRGDYVVSGKGLRGQGDASGYATNTISINGVPANAVVVGAFLYWETIESTAAPSAGDAFFQGYSIVGKSIGSQTPPCWSAGGGTGSSNGSITLRVYRADVKPYLVANGAYTANGSFQVRVRDSGSTGNATPLAEGASLVVVYQTVSAPLKSVVIYDGAYTMNNSTAAMNLDIRGFYQAESVAGGAQGRLTHVVADGQDNFTERLYFNEGFVADNPFQGTDGFSWDSATFNVPVPDDADHVTTQVVPISSSFDCLSWGAVIFSTPVKDRDRDALLDRWETEHGYTDMQDGSFVSLPGSDPDVRDLFVQMDYLKAAAGSGSPAHSHLLKQESINTVGQAFARQGIRLHVDTGSKYPASEFVIGSGLGGNAIDEGEIACSDSSSRLCQFPNLSGVISWKGGIHEVKNKYFQHGRKDSYRYLLSGHTLGLAAKSWSIGKQSLVGISCCTVSAGKNVATVTTAAAHGITRNQRVTVSGAISDWDLNGTYLVQSVTTTSFTISASSVTAGEYGRFPAQALGVSGNHFNEPNLAVSTGTITSTSGFSDLGGGDHYIALGLWRADDPMDCQTDPAVPLNGQQKYCNDRVGSALVQAGTWAHEFGHLLLLTHGGVYAAQNEGASPSFGANCKSNFVSSMNYLFQIRGIPGGIVDFSGQNLSNLDEPTLVEANGLGRDTDTQQLPQYGTRWYAPLNYLDSLLQGASGGRIARTHCDGSPTSPGEAMVRIEAPTVANGQLAPIDWNNNGIFTDVVHSQDVNFNGAASDTGFAGFNDWAAIDLQQLGARRNVGGFSVDVSGSDVLGGGSDVLGGGSDVLGGGSDVLGGGSDVLGGGSDVLGGGSDVLGGGVELNFEIANATVDAPTDLVGTPGFKNVVLNWNAPGFGLIRAFYVWRADVTKNPMSATNPPKNIGTLKATSGTPPTTFTDTNVKTNATYRYFVTAALGAESGVNSGNQSGPSNFADVLVK